jgi:hypothetical protein
MAAKMPTTKARTLRNTRIKSRIIRLMGQGYSLKEASYLTADRYYLSQRTILRVYYETILRDPGEEKDFEPQRTQSAQRKELRQDDGATHDGEEEC